MKNSNKAWTPKEDDKLVKLCEKGYNLTEIAIELERSNKACKTRLAILGKYVRSRSAVGHIYNLVSVTNLSPEEIKQFKYILNREYVRKSDLLNYTNLIRKAGFEDNIIVNYENVITDVRVAN